MPSPSTQSRTRLTREKSRARIIEAATELVRVRSYAELNVGEIMDRAGIGRTIFYRHFDDLGDLLLSAGREAIGELYEAQVALASTRAIHDSEAVRQALEVPVAVYRRHGPLLRAVLEAAAADQLVAAGQERLRRQFDALVVDALQAMTAEGGREFADVAETARALNLLNETYLLDAFGREPRVSAETAVQTLTELWVAFINR
jgi:AcrR family transcriptional regulator